MGRLYDQIRSRHFSRQQRPVAKRITGGPLLSEHSVVEALEPRILLSTTLTGPQKADAISGTTALGTQWATMAAQGDLSSEILSLLNNASLENQLDLGAQFADVLADASVTYLNGDATPTLEEWSAALAASAAAASNGSLSLSVDGIDIPDFAPGATDVYFDFDFHLAGKLADLPVNLSGDLTTAEISQLGIGVSSDTLSLDVIVDLDASIRFGVDDTLGFYITPGTVSAAMDISESGSASFTAGMFSLASSSIAATLPSYTITTSDPGTTADSAGKICEAELLAAAGADLFDSTLVGTAGSFTIPLASTDGTIVLGAGVGFSYTAADVVADATFEFGTSNFSDLVRLSGLTPDTLASGLYRLEQSLKGLDTLPVMDIELAFCNGTEVGDVIDFSGGMSSGIGSGLYSIVSDQVTASFSTWDEFMAGMDGYYSAVAYDANSMTLSFDVEDTYEFAGQVVPLTFYADLSPLTLSTSSTLDLEASASYEYTLGVDLGVEQELTIYASAEDVATESTLTDGQLSGNATFEVTVNHWDSYTVTVAKAATDNNDNLFDLVDDINTALAAAGTDVEAALFDFSYFNRIVTEADLANPNYNGVGRIILKTTDVNDWAFKVEVAGGNVAATELGFATTSFITANQADVYLEDAVLGADINVTGNGLEALATLGMTDMTFGDGSASITASTSGSIAHPDTASARVSVSEMSQNAHRWDEMITLDLVGNGSIILTDVSVQGVSGNSQQAGAQIEVAVADINAPTDQTVVYTDLGNVQSISTSNPASILNVLDGGSSYFSVLGNHADLNTSIPVVNSSILSLLDLSGDFAGKMAAARSAVNANGSLQELTGELNDIFGLGGAGTFDLTLEGDNVHITLDYPVAVSEVMALSLNVDSLWDLTDRAAENLQLKAIVDNQGTSNVTVVATADVHLELGLDISDPANATGFIYDDTTLDLTLSAVGEDMALGFTSGALALFIKDGWVAVDGDGDPATNDTMTWSVTIDGDDGKHYWGDGGEPLTDDIVSTMSGAADLSLPLYYPSDSVPLGGAGANAFTVTIADINEYVADTAESVVVGSPDLSGLFDGMNVIAVLSNPGMVIDGLQTGLAMAEASVTQTIEAINLPLVGDALSDSVSFVADIGDGLLESIRTTINRVLDDSSPVELIQLACFSAFGSPGLNILRDSTGDGSVDVNDVVLTVDDAQWQYVEYQMDIGQTLFSQQVDFDLGIDQLPLSLDGAVEFTLAWNWDFRFGIHATEGFYIVDTGDRELDITLDVTMPETLTGELFFLQADVSPLNEDGDVDFDRSLLYGSFYVDMTDPSGDGLITQSEIRTSAVSDLITAGFEGGLDAKFELIGSLGGSTQFPRIRTEIGLVWLYNKELGDVGVETEPDITFDAVQLDTGSFVSGLLRPIFVKVDEIIDPARPVLDFLTSELPVIGMSPTDIASAFGYAQYAAFVEAADWVADMTALVANLPEGEVWIDLGSFSVDPNNGDIDPVTMEDFNNNVNASLATADTKSFMQQANGGNANFQLHILEPSTIFNMLMGNDVTLVSFSIPSLTLSAGYSQFFSICGPLGMRIGGDLEVELNYGFGYDTYGIRRASETGNYAYIADGMYISDRANVDGTGDDIAETTIKVDLYAAGELNAVVAKGGVRGGIYGEMGFNLNDPNNDGKVRLSELVGNMLQGPQYIFDVHALVEAYIKWYVEFGISPFKVSKSGTLAEVTLYEESWSASSDPVLVTPGEPGQIVINMGDYATDRLHGDKDGGSESFRLSPAGGGMMRVSFDGQTQDIAYTPGDTILVNAGTGDDTLIIDAGIDINVEFNGGPGNDRVEMNGNGWLHADGGPGNDYLSAGSGADILIGGDGDDTLIGGSGDDILDGGLGDDIISDMSGYEIYRFDDGFGQDTLNDSDGQAHADFSLVSSPLTFDTTTLRVDVDATSDRVDLASYTSLITGSSGVDTINGRVESNTWTITGADEGDYNDDFDFASFERLIGRSEADYFVFEDGGHISNYLDGGSGDEDEADSTYATRTTTDVLDLSDYTSSARWQISEVDGGRLFLATASPEFSNIESHTGGSDRDYLVMSNDKYITGLFDGGAGQDRITIDDYKLVDTYKKNIWDFTGYNSGSLNQRSAFVNVENYNGGNNEDIMYVHPAGTYAAGTFFAPAGTGGKIEGSIDNEGENDRINNCPPYQPQTSYPAEYSLTTAPMPAMMLGDVPMPQGAPPAGLDVNDYDVVWRITGVNSGERTADGVTVTFTNTQTLEGAAGRDLFIILPGGSLDGHIDGQGGDDTLVYGWDGDAWSDPVSVSFSTATQASATAIGGYTQNIEHYVSGDNAGDVLTGANLPSTWTLTSTDEGQLGNTTVTFFEGFEDLRGGTGEDLFVFNAGASVTVGIDGRQGDDTIDLSSHATDTAWTISGSGSGSFQSGGSPAVTFAGMESATSGTGDDTYTFTADGRMSGTIASGSGTDTLQCEAITVPMRWTLLYAGAGNVIYDGITMNMTGIDRIDSGTGNDRFTFTDGGDFDGVIDAGDGTDIFDYSGFSVVTAVTVDLENLVATGVSAFADVETFIAGLSSSDQFIGKDNFVCSWSVTDYDDGQVQFNDGVQDYTRSFYDFEILQGGTGDDTFAFNDMRYVRESVDGGSGNDTVSFDGYSLPQTWTINAAGGGTLFMDQTRDPLSLSFADIENLVTGDEANTIRLRTGGALTSLTGGDGADVLDMSSYATSAVTVDLEQATMTPITHFAGIDTMHGTAASDTLIGWDENNTWQVTADNAGTVSNATPASLVFTSFENLTGGSADDQFIFSDGMGVSGAVDAMAGTDTLNYAAYSTAVILNRETLASTNIASGYANVESIVGGSASDTLIATNTPNTWNIVASNAGNIAGAPVFSFSGVENLTGGTDVDTFVFSDAATVSGTIDGAGASNTLDYSDYTTAVAINMTTLATTGTAGYSNIDVFIGGNGSDTLTGPDADTAWTITNDNAGTVGNLATFTSFENLTGMSGADSFTFADGKQVSGVVTGGAGADSISYANQSLAVTVDRHNQAASWTGGYSSVEQWIGSPVAGDSLTGENQVATWTLTTVNGGYIDDAATFAFSGFENLSGGTQADTFMLQTNGMVEGQIAAGDGDDTLDLSLQVVGRTLEVTADNAVDLDGMAVLSVENLVGSSGDDQVVVQDGVGLDGQAHGGDGDDVLSYAAYSAAVTVNRQSGQATGITGGVSGFESIIGGTGDDTLIGVDGVNTWTLTANDAGTVTGADAMDFAGMENLVGGTADDVFVLANGLAVSGSIDGAAGDNTLDYSDYATPVTVNLGENTATATGGYQHITTFVGGLNDDELVGPAEATTWRITANNAGTIDYDSTQITFESFENLTGNTEADAFIFSDACVLGGGVDGAGGTDVLDFSAYTMHNVWTRVNDVVTIDSAAGTFDYVNIEDYVGGMTVFMFDDTDFEILINDDNLPDILSPGQEETATVQLWNRSNHLYSDVIDVALYLSTDSTLDVGQDVLVGSVDAKRIALAMDSRLTMDVPIELPRDIDLDTYVLIAQVDPADRLDERNESNNIAVSNDTHPVVLRFGEVLDGDSFTLTVPDSEGVAVTFNIRGNGVGQITDESLQHITVTGTDANSVLTISVPDGSTTTIDQLTVDGDLKSLLAPAVNITSELVVQGGLTVLQLNDLKAGAQTQIDIGDYAEGNRKLNMTLGDLVDAELTLDTPVNSLTVNSWVDSDANQDTLDASSIARLSIADSALPADILVDGELGDLQVAEGITGDVTADRIGRITVTAGGITGDITSPQGIDSLLVEAGDLTGDITIANGELTRMTIEQGDLQNNLTAGAIKQLTVESGDVNVQLETTGNLDRMTIAGGDVSGQFIIGGSLNSLSLTDGDLAAVMEIAGWLKSTSLTSGSVTGNITVVGDIGQMKIAGGDLDGRVLSTAGSLQSIFCSALYDSGTDQWVGGNIDGTIRTLGDITKIATSRGDITGQIYATGILKSIDVRGGDVSGSVGSNLVLQSLAAKPINGVGGAVNAEIDISGPLLKLNAGASSNMVVNVESIGTINVTGDLSGLIDAENPVDGTLTIRKIQVSGGDLDATVTANGAINDIRVNARQDVGGAISGDIAADGHLKSLATHGNLDGDITVGSLGQLRVSGGDVDGAITTTIAAVDLTERWSINRLDVRGGDLNGDVIAAGPVNDIRVSATRDVGGAITGDITADGHLKSLATRGDLDGEITVGSLGQLRVNGGDVDGAITTTTAAVDLTERWSINRLDVRGGDLNGDVIAAGPVNDIRVSATRDVGGAIRGDITVDGHLKSLATRGDLDGDITVGSLGQLLVNGGDLDGTITTTIADGDLTERWSIRKIDLRNGDLNGEIVSAGLVDSIQVKDSTRDGDHGDITGDITSQGLINKISVQGGTVFSEIVAAGFGKITVAKGSVAGDIRTAGDIADLSVKAATNAGDALLQGSMVQVGGTLNKASFTGSLAGAAGEPTLVQICAAQIGRLQVRGDVNHARILAGVDLGDDDAIGGVGANADQTAVGLIERLDVSGDVNDSLIAAGMMSNAGEFNLQWASDNAGFIVGSQIERLSIKGQLTSSSGVGSAFGVGAAEVVNVRIGRDAEHELIAQAS